jgi:hypothetical protein
MSEKKDQEPIDWEAAYMSLERIRTLAASGSFAQVIEMHCDIIEKTCMVARQRYGIGGNDTLVYEWDSKHIHPQSVVISEVPEPKEPEIGLIGHEEAVTVEFTAETTAKPVSGGLSPAVWLFEATDHVNQITLEIYDADTKAPVAWFYYWLGEEHKVGEPIVKAAQRILVERAEKAGFRVCGNLL